MEREFSSGGLVLRFMRKKWHLAVIEPAGRENESGKPLLALPKGWINAGEKPPEAALREVREETGIEAQVIAKLGDIKYVYVRKWSDGARVFKVVSFYLLRYVTGDIGNISAAMRKEVLRALWVPLDEAPESLAYKGERQMAEKALEYAAEHPKLETVDAETTEPG
ncbi:MAG: NUDIX domain-containing protein [Acidobacteriales bacterium]|nr:NUDIX domain-containing protein [Terriglobales bacterium]